MVTPRNIYEIQPRRPYTVSELEALHGRVETPARAAKPWPLLAMVFALFAIAGFALAALVIPALYSAPIFA
jgi:hypothetical protein